MLPSLQCRERLHSKNPEVSVWLWSSLKLVWRGVKLGEFLRPSCLSWKNPWWWYSLVSLVSGRRPCSPSVSQNATWAASIVPPRTRSPCAGFAAVLSDAADVTQWAGRLFDSVWGLTGRSLWSHESFLTLLPALPWLAGCTVTRQSGLPLGTTTGHRDNLKVGGASGLIHNLVQWEWKVGGSCLT